MDHKNKDTIPPALKEFFFTDKSPPSLLSDYDAIGFDCDHCMVKYNVVDKMKLIISVFLQALHEDHDYPEEVRKFDWEKSLLYHLNCGVWDIEHGTVLKLGEGGVVTHAVHGFEVLSRK